MGKSRLSAKEKAALSAWWGNVPLRVRDGNVELRKGDCWGILCSIAEGKKNAAIIIEKEKASCS